MLGKTHVIAGGMAGYLAFPHIGGIIVGGIAGLLPDIDEPESILGRVVRFISVPLNKIFGHRTVTHSLLFSILCYFAIHTMNREIALAFLLGIFSHIVGDMVTGIVKFFWPLPIWVGIPLPHFLYKSFDMTIRIALIAVLGFWIFAPTMLHNEIAFMHSIFVKIPFLITQT